ncbi:hypothetical protein BsWGS_23538 [Bradybaena similaris]
MRIKLRTRCPFRVKDCILQSLSYTLAGFRACHRRVWILLGVTFLVIYIWRSTSDSGGCDGNQLLEFVCKEYSEKYTSGSLCHDLCISKELHLYSCYTYKNSVKNYKSGNLVFKVASNLSWRQERIEEGLQSSEFLKLVDELLQHELGNTDTSTLMNQLVLDFDTNRDGKINLGEAQNMWWVLRQPDFLNFYIFQDSVSIPHLNGTCGGISIWYNLHLSQGSTLYRRATPWPVSLLTNNAYRWTLPAWIYRARAMLSLIELAEELYDRDGVRYHLCNVDGLSLHHHGSYEVILTEDTMLLSSQQIRNKLSNITCQYAHDCILTPQCQTMCDFSSRQCSGKVTRPTLAFVCDIMEDYLLFDAPKTLKITLSRLIHRCQSLSVYTQMLDLVHSIIVLDLKNVLWNYIQNKVK